MIHFRGNKDPMVLRIIRFSGVFILIIIFASAAQGQRILGAFSIGTNLTQVDGDEFYGFNKPGINLGPQVIVPFGRKKNLSFSLELLYSQKGSLHNGVNDSTNFRIEFDYAEIPVLFRITDKKVVSAGVGFSYGQLINYKETDNPYYDTIFQYQTALKNNDISVIGEIQFKIWSKLWFNLRYQYSMFPLRTVLVTNPQTYPKNPFTREQYNNVICARLTWIFNQPKTVKGEKIELKQQE